MNSAASLYKLFVPETGMMVKKFGKGPEIRRLFA